MHPSANRRMAPAGDGASAFLDMLLANYAPGLLAGEMKPAGQPKAGDPSAAAMTPGTKAMTTYTLSSPPPPAASAALGLHPAAAVGRDVGAYTRAMPQQQQQQFPSPDQPAVAPSGSAGRQRSRARLLAAIQQLSGHPVQQQQQQPWLPMQPAAHHSSSLPVARDVIHSAAAAGNRQHPLQQAPGAGAAAGCQWQQVQHEQAAWQQGRLMLQPASQQEQQINQILQGLLKSRAAAAWNPPSGAGASQRAAQPHHQQPQMTRQATWRQQQLAVPHPQQHPQQQPRQQLAHPLLAAGAEDDLFEALDSWLEAERAEEEADALGSSFGSSLGSAAAAAARGSCCTELLLVDGFPAQPVQPVQRHASDVSVLTQAAGRPPVSPDTPLNHSSGLGWAPATTRDASWGSRMGRQFSDGLLHQACFTDSLAAAMGSAMMGSPPTARPSAFAGVASASLPQPLAPNACSSSSNTSSSLPPRAPAWQASGVDAGGRVLKRSWSEPTDTAKRARSSGWSM